MLQVSTRNGAGITAHSPLLLNFGADFDFDAAKALAGADDSFKGALDMIFRSQKEALLRECQENEQQALEEISKQEEQAKADRAAKQEQMEKEEEEAEKRRKMADDAKAKEEEEARERKRLAEAVAGASKKARIGVTPIYSSKQHGLDLILAEPGGVSARLALQNTRTMNVKLPKDSVVGMFSKDTVLEKEGNGFPYTLTLKATIFDKALGKKMTLDKYIKEIHPETKSIYKYKEFPPGALHKVLVQEDAAASYAFGSKAPHKAAILEAVERARSLKGATLTWMVKYNGKHHRIEPNGLVLLLTKQIIVPGEGESDLE